VEKHTRGMRVMIKKMAFSTTTDAAEPIKALVL
jgi:hypothetical protein